MWTLLVNGFDCKYFPKPGFFCLVFEWHPKTEQNVWFADSHVAFSYSKTICKTVWFSDWFFMWSPLLRRHLSDHLLWSICRHSDGDLNTRPLLGVWIADSYPDGSNIWGSIIGIPAVSQNLKQKYLPNYKNVGVLSPNFKFMKFLVTNVERHVFNDEENDRSEIGKF